MNIIQLRDLYRQSESLADQTITICGWVRSNRDSKSFGFLSIHDGTFFQPVQVVYDDKLANYDIVRKINVGTALIISGQLLLTPEAKQPFEIHASGIEVEGDCPGDYPLQKKRHSFEYLRTISHLRPRTNTFQAVFRVQRIACRQVVNAKRPDSCLVQSALLPEEAVEVGAPAQNKPLIAVGQIVFRQKVNKPIAVQHRDPIAPAVIDILRALIALTAADKQRRPHGQDQLILLKLFQLSHTDTPKRSGLLKRYAGWSCLAAR